MNSVEFEREKNVGGSDIPSLVGVSKFNTPVDVLYSKLSQETCKRLDIEKKTFVGNIYTEVGNIFEPKIQECLGLGYDQERYFGEIDGFGMRVHIDGAIDIHKENIGLHEIKVVSYVGKSNKPYEMHKTNTKNKVLETYMPQIQFQMLLTNQKENTLTILPRNNKVKNKLASIRKEYGLSPLQDKGEFNDEILWKTVTDRLQSEFKDYEVTKEELILVKVKRDEKTIESIMQHIKVLVRYINKLEECECQFEALSLVQDFEREIRELKGKDNNELLEQHSNELLSMEKQMVAFKALQEKYNAEKKKLEELMVENGIHKFETPNGIKISRGKDTPDEEIEEIDWETIALVLTRFAKQSDVDDIFERHTEKKIKKGKKGTFRISIPKPLLNENKQLGDKNE